MDKKIIKRIVLLLVTAVTVLTFAAGVASAEPSIKFENDAVTVTDAPTNSKLILAFYNDGRLEGIRIIETNGNSAEGIPQGYDRVRAFLWDMQTITPLSSEAKACDTLYIKANGAVLEADFENNSSAEEFIERLKQGDVTVDMHDYGSFEKVGELGFDIVRNDTQITTSPGDVILYLGNNITIYYDTNSWSFTKLAKIRNATKDGLLQVFGEGNVTVTFSLNK